NPQCRTTGVPLLRIRVRQASSALLCAALAVLACPTAPAESSLPAPVLVSSNWQLQEASKVAGSGKALSSPAYKADGWYAATVPGTVLTSLVNDKVYPEPLYGENNRPDKIPETLNKSRWWYRTTLQVPTAYSHRQVWLNFDGINYAAEVWVNGRQLGTIKGAFIRGVFDITALVKAGGTATLAVLVSPQPHPGDPHEHTIANGTGKNGGITAIDGPTFLSTIGWDWIPAIRDRDTGIWQKVFLSASGPVLVKDPLVTTDLPLPRTDSADVAVKATLENTSSKAQTGVLKASFGDVQFEQPVTLAAHATQVIAFDPRNTPALHLSNPKLWWPNGYGPQNLYTLHLSFEQKQQLSDTRDVTFGVRKITYSVPGSDNLTISVNGVKVMIRGGDWGLDEAMKRIPRERLEAEIHMHALANMNLIRNWVGQSTGDDFYELCDKYGILLWDEFFQPNPSDGPNPTDLETYLANVRDKILRYRNHPSIAVWCARNEGYPPKNIDDPLRVLLAELEPTRRYQPSSTEGGGVHSGGPYFWRRPQDYYVYEEAFKTEVGSVSVPTIESLQGMMPQADWETINDDWAEHDLTKGAQAGNRYPLEMAERYGKVANMADFVRKAQLMNYEAFRAMYEGRNAKMFAPVTGVITWMSAPAQPSFVWQLYHYDLEANAALYAVKKAGEPVHIQLNESDWNIEVVNNRPEALTGARAHLDIYTLDGKAVYQHDYEVAAPGSATTRVSAIDWPTEIGPAHFMKLTLVDAAGRPLSDNFYWRADAGRPDDLRALNSLKTVTLEATIDRQDSEGQCHLVVSLHNPGTQVALMTHLQLRRQGSGARVLPVYYSDNYLSLVPGETRTISIDAALSDVKGEVPLVAVDGWNVGVTASSSPQAAVALNENAQVSHWPVTNLPIQGAVAGAGTR
ncbi:MAG TPA: glycoside hydrolase family 2 TIM barrel-domain containing protein, partial [Acidobacteriaceae bacterium]